MPELPEVEVVKKSLKKKIEKKIIKEIDIYDGNLRYKVKKNHIKQIIGLKILKIERKSKYLIFYFQKNLVMLVHLGMTGKFFISTKNRLNQKTSFYYDIDQVKDKKYNRIVFKLSHKINLIYNDVRKFGFIKIDKIENLSNNSHLSQLGPEPLHKNFNYIYFINYCQNRERSVKNLLMDQKFVSGLGNIYVNEILFLSKINPKRNIKKLKSIEIDKIIFNTKKILKKAIKFGGSSIKDFSSSTGKKGNYQQHFSVYGMRGSKCTNNDCKSLIQKIVISNRSSFFCPNCQK